MVTYKPLPIEALNSVRFARADFKKRLRATRRTTESMALLADALEQRPDYLRNAPIDDVLGWVYCMQARIARRLLAGASIQDPWRPVGALSDRQIDVLARSLRAPTVSGRRELAC